MIKQYVWIGIAVGVFFVGLAAGYGLFGTLHPQMSIANEQQIPSQMKQNPQMLNQWTQQMMQNQTGRQQMMTSVVQNHQFMSEMMNQTQFREQIIANMKQNHSFTQGMLMDMMNDPQLRTQMIGHLL